MSPRNALNRLLRRGTQRPRRPGRAAPPRPRAGARTAPAADGLTAPCEQVRELLDQALEEERRALFPIPDDSARMAEAELDALPETPPARCASSPTTNGARPRRARSTSRSRSCCAARCSTRSSRACATRCRTPRREDLQRVRDMMRALNDMLDADARGEHTQEQFAEFMAAVRRLLPRTAAEPRRADRRARAPGGRRAAVDGLADPRTARRARRPDGQRPRRRRPGRARWPGCSRACARPARTCRGAGASGWTATRAWASPTPPARWPNSPTSTSSRNCSARTTPGPASTTSTRN